MYSVSPILWYHFKANLIWWDAPVMDASDACFPIIFLFLSLTNGTKFPLTHTPSSVATSIPDLLRSVTFEFPGSEFVRVSPGSFFFSALMALYGITKFYVQIFSSFGYPYIRLHLEENCSSEMWCVLKKPFLLTIAERCLGSGFLKKTYRFGTNMFLKCRSWWSFSVEASNYSMYLILFPTYQCST